MKLFAIFLIALVVFSVSTQAQIFQEQPDLTNCNEGALTESEKQMILDYVNDIRTRIGLKPVIYDHAGQESAQKAALVSAANAALSHTPPQSWECYSQTAYYGCENSNLYISGSNPGNPINSKTSIELWMYDPGQPQLGHRRAIINPFVTSMAFGRVDGNPKVNPGAYVSAMSLKYLDNLPGQGSDIGVDYVAYPKGDIPPNLFWNDWYMNFSAIYNRTSWWNNTQVDYSNAKITVTGPGGTLNIRNVTSQYLNWGGIPTCLQWIADGIQNNVEYTVNIQDVNVNGQNKDYSYTFRITNSGGPGAPEIPVLESPANGSIVEETEVILKWKTAQNADSYNLSLSIGGDEVLYTNITNNQVLINNLSSETTYAWRVNSENEVGKSQWSEEWSFTTANFKPGTAILLAPPDKDTDVRLDPMLEWSRIDDADSYTVQISEYSNFDPVLKKVEGLDKNRYQITNGLLEQSKTYYWAVHGVKNNTPGDWSEMSSFTTTGPNSVYYFTEIPGSIEKVYPNPTEGIITVELNLEKDIKALFEVYSVNGELISIINKGKISQGSSILTLDISFLQSGNYYVKLTETGEMIKLQVMR